MTVQEIADQLRAAGVSEHVIGEEAPYLASTYGESPEIGQVIAQAIPNYLQRSASGRDYSTSQNDPAISYGGQTAAGRTDSAVLGEAAPGGLSGWFAANMPAGGGGMGDGAPPEYATLDRPSYLQGPYQPPTWNEQFTAPTLDDLLKDPGFLAAENAMQRGLERSAAAQGKVLSGGFVGRTLPRALAENTQNAYQGLYDRRKGEYTQRYGQFQDKASMGAQARGINETAYQNDVSNQLGQYNARYRAYQDRIQNNLDLARLGLSATTAGAA